MGSLMHQADCIDDSALSWKVSPPVLEKRASPYEITYKTFTYESGIARKCFGARP